MCRVDVVDGGDGVRRHARRARPLRDGLRARADDDEAVDAQFGGELPDGGVLVMRGLAQFAHLTERGDAAA